MRILSSVVGQRFLSISRVRNRQASAKVKMPEDQKYWLPGYGLSRHIVFGHIHYFLGPSASVWPYIYQVTFDAAQ